MTERARLAVCGTLGMDLKETEQLVAALHVVATDGAVAMAQRLNR